MKVHRCLLPLCFGLLLGPVAGRAASDSPTAFPAPGDLPATAGLPDLLRNDDGSPVITPAQWTARRERMKAVIEHYELGHAPPPPGNVRGEVVRQESVLAGKATYRLVNLTFGPGGSLRLQVALFLPGDGDGIYPTIVHPQFTRTPGGYPTPGIAGSASAQAAPSPEAAAANAAPVLERGYALLTYDYQQGGLDRPDNRASGYFPAFPDYDWGTETAWAWGLSRAIDYLETQPFADKTRLIAVGHSRLGKMVLLAGAFDDRINLCVPAGSGTGGTAAYRFTGEGRGGKEGLERIVKVFPQWYIPRLAEFAGQVEKLPFDAHSLIALHAPRSLLIEDGTDDSSVNLPAVEQSYRAAKPVYVLLGAADRLGIFVRPGGHHLQAEDWAIILDFADQELRGKTVARKFDQFPASGDALK